jgi:hypothetical protein
MKNKKILIGVGCSHTQGCAILSNESSEKSNRLGLEMIELASPELKKLYKKEKVSTEWITENFTWVGHLGKLLNVDKVYNFGAGSRGLEYCIRSLRNYSFRVKDLTNHLILLQIPSFDRIEILHLDNGSWTYKQPTDVINEVQNMNNKWKTYFQYFHELDTLRYKLLNELYFLQDYMEKLGAKFYCFDNFTGDIEYIRDKSEFIDNSPNVGRSTLCRVHGNWSLNENDNIEIKKIIDRLNLIDIMDPDSHRQEPVILHHHTLHNEKLVKDDMHLSGTGNKYLAKALYNFLKIEKVNNEINS